MWATEYLIHEHRQELLRTAEQIHLIREAQAQPRPRVIRRWALKLVDWLQLFRRPRRRFQRTPLAAPAILERGTT